jgi:glycosyltransferase involved in cell wall biosynthesis
VGTLAAFTPQKDPESWVRTVTEVCSTDPDIRFRWAGEGELRRQVKVELDRAGLAGRVDLPGFVDDPSRDFWPEIDAFFLPSAFEALGTVLLDALAREIPVVATSVGGIPEIVRPGREGLLADRGNVAALADALRQLKRTPEQAREMGRAGRERALVFEIGRVVERIVELYERLTRERGSG